MILLAFEPAPLKMKSRSLTVHTFQLKKDRVGVKKKKTKKKKQQLVNKDVRITSIPIKGRHSCDAEMNAESFGVTFRRPKQSLLYSLFFESRTLEY